MKLTFWGAARQVTGSMYLLELADGYRILIDCGTDMQSLREENPQPNPGGAFFPFEPSSLNVVLLTHAHIDHSGNIPNLYRDGYEGQVLCTPATADLTQLLLLDSARLHRKRRQRAEGASNRKRRQQERLQQQGDAFSEKEVEQALDEFVPIHFNRRFLVCEGVWLTFIPAGHLLGAAHLLLEIEEDGRITRLCFSGDIGRRDTVLHATPEPVPQVDYLICESTYGSRVHLDDRPAEEALADVIRRTCINVPGRLIIPAFSVGRTQALLYTLNRLYSEQGFKPIQVFSDSPLARSSSRVYEKHHQLLNGEARRFRQQEDGLFDFENFTYLETEKASRAVSNYHQPCIIISASGMVSGGRVEQHVAANIGNPYCTILMVGYAAEGTLGDRLLNGQNTLRIGEREHPVLAKVEKIDIFSGHADANDLYHFVQHQQPDHVRKIFLIHGEEEAMRHFSERLHEGGYTQVEIPFRGQTFEL